MGGISDMLVISSEWFECFALGAYFLALRQRIDNDVSEAVKYIFISRYSWVEIFPTHVPNGGQKLQLTLD